MLKSLALLVTAMVLPAAAGGQESAPEQVPAHFELFGAASISNSYARGNLDDWFAAVTNTPGQAVDAGSPAFFHGRASMFASHAESTPFEIGFGIGVNIPVDHSLWGTSTFFGGRSEVVLKPMVATAYLPIRILPQGSSGIALTLWPGLSYGAILGDMDLGSTHYDVSGGDGIGATAAASLDMFFGDILGFSAEVGFRMLKANLIYEDSSSPTGYKQPQLASGESVIVDLGGSYALVGLILRF